MFCPEIELIAEGKSLKEGIDLLRRLETDLVFLDIELGDGLGLDLLKSLPNRYFQVIFITAHNKFAVQAFRLSALDYLMKPIDVEELIQAVAKAKEWKANENKLTRLETLAENMNNKEAKEKKIILKTLENMYVLAISEILYCEAEGSYTTFHTADKKKLLVSKNIKEYENTLKDFDFVRSHKSYLVNLNQVKSYSKVTIGTVLVLKTGEQIPISTRRREEVIRLLNAD